MTQSHLARMTPRARSAGSTVASVVTSPQPRSSANARRTASRYSAGSSGAKGTDLISRAPVLLPPVAPVRPARAVSLLPPSPTAESIQPHADRVRPPAAARASMPAPEPQQAQPRSSVDAALPTSFFELRQARRRQNSGLPHHAGRRL